MERDPLNRISVWTCEFSLSLSLSLSLIYLYLFYSTIIRRVVEENVTGFADSFQIKIFSNQACIGKKDIHVFLNTNEESLQTEVNWRGVG